MKVSMLRKITLGLAFALAVGTAYIAFVRDAEAMMVMLAEGGGGGGSYGTCQPSSSSSSSGGCGSGNW